MTSEANLVIAVWEAIKDIIPAARRNEATLTIMRAFEEYGFEKEQLLDLLDEEDQMTNAFRVVFDMEEDDEAAEWGEGD